MPWDKAKAAPHILIKTPCRWVAAHTTVALASGWMDRVVSGRSGVVSGEVLRSGDLPRWLRLRPSDHDWMLLLSTHVYLVSGGAVVNIR